MNKAISQQLSLQVISQLNEKLSIPQKSLLLGVGMEGLTRQEMKYKVSLITQKLTNEEVVFLLRIKFTEQCLIKHQDALVESLSKRCEGLIQRLMGEDLTEKEQWSIRADLVFTHLLPRVKPAKDN